MEEALCKFAGNMLMCDGKKCRMKDNCFRHTAPDDGEFQEYFITPPKQKKSCDYYWDKGNVKDRLTSRYALSEIEGLVKDIAKGDYPAIYIGKALFVKMGAENVLLEIQVNNVHPMNIVLCEIYMMCKSEIYDDWELAQGILIENANEQKVFGEG